MSENLRLFPIKIDLIGQIQAYSPLYRHSIQFLQPHFQKDAVRYNLQVSKDKPPETFGEKLRYARYQKGLLQREVAEMAGVSRSTYAEWENGGTVSEEMREVLGEVMDRNN